MLEWLILYADETTFSNLDGTEYEARRYGVMETFFMDPATGVGVESSKIGHWIWKSNRWFACDDHMGFWDYMFHHPGPTLAIFGRTLHDLEWQTDIHQKTTELLKTPKSAWRARERRP